MFFQVLAILIGLLAHPASAATAQDVAVCRDFDQNDAQIAACSRIIADKTTPEKDRLMALYNRGVACQSKDSYSEAIADFTALLERKAIGLVYADRGFCYQRLYDYKRSIDDLAEALRLDPSLAQAHKWRGVSYVNLGENVNALADYNEYLARDPKAVPAYIHRAMAFVALGDADRAIADASKAMEFEPRNGEALAARGDAYRAAGDLRRAIDDYTAAVRFGNDRAETYHARGLAYRMQGDRDNAITDFKMAIRLRPADSLNSRAELKALGIEAPPFDPNAAPNAKAIMDWLK